NGCDQRHHARNRERGHGEEADHVLALRGHQLDLAQRHGDPNHARERKEDEHERTRGLPKDVPAEHPCPPACPWPALRPFSVDYRFGLSLRTIALANRPRHSLWPIWPIALANRSGQSLWPIALANRSGQSLWPVCLTPELAKLRQSGPLRPSRLTY